MTSFEQWFSADWQKALRDIPEDAEALSSGLSIRAASWDRRAAYLVWVAHGRPRAGWVEQTAPLYDKKARPSDDVSGSDEKTNTSGEPVKSPAENEHDGFLDLLGGTAMTTDDFLELLG